MRPISRGTVVLCIIIAAGLLLGTLGLISLSDNEPGQTTTIPTAR